MHSLKPLSSRDQEKSQAKAAAEQPDGSIPPVAGFEGATTDYVDRSQMKPRVLNELVLYFILGLLCDLLEHQQFGFLFQGA